MKGLTKKVGPLPLWMWLAIAGTVGYIVYKKSKGAKEEGVEEGYFPTQGIPSEAAETPGSGGLAGLGNLIGELAAAGFVPAGSEAAHAEPGEPAEPANPWREWYEEGGDPRAAPAAAAASVKKVGKKAKAKAKATNQGSQKGNPRGTGSRGAHAGVGPGHPASGQHRNQNQTAHSAGTSHQAAAHPAQRGVGAGHPAGGGGNHKRRR
jgi:hypothetical protein